MVYAPIIQSSDWSAPFEIMCDANDYVVGGVLGQKKDRKMNATTKLARLWMMHKLIMQP